jgi:HSP20 family protein
MIANHIRTTLSIERGENKMTLYVSRPYNRMARRMLNDMIQETQPEYERRLKVPMNVHMQEDAFVVTALLPGVQSDDLNIQIVNENITIEGELKQAESQEGEWLAHEIPFGKFYRSISLPDALDASKAEAELHDGILQLRVPKAEEAMPKTIKIKTDK